MSTPWYKIPILNLSSVEKAVLESIKAPKSIAESVRLTNFPRATTTYAIQKLLKKKLLHTVAKGKRQKYTALSEAEAIGIFNDSIALVAKIDSKTATKTLLDRNFIIHTGARDMAYVLERAIAAHPGQRIRGIQPNKSWMSAHRKNTYNLVKLNEMIKDNRIIMDGIIQKSAYKKYRAFFSSSNKLKKMVASFDGRMADYVAVDDNYFDQNAELVIFSDLVFLTNWEREVTIELRDQYIVDLLRDMFDIIKTTERKIDHNQEMKSIEKLP